MKIKELMARLSELPPEDDIVMYGHYCEIMGDQSVNDTIMIEKETVYGWTNKRGYTLWQSSVSNSRGDITKDVWVIQS